MVEQQKHLRERRQRTVSKREELFGEEIPPCCGFGGVRKRTCADDGGKEKYRVLFLRERFV